MSPRYREVVSNFSGLVRIPPTQIGKPVYAADTHDPVTSGFVGSETRRSDDGREPPQLWARIRWRIARRPAKLMVQQFADVLSCPSVLFGNGVGVMPGDVGSGPSQPGLLLALGDDSIKDGRLEVAQGM